MDGAPDMEHIAGRDHHHSARMRVWAYEIRINGAAAGRFDDLRDAAASAGVAKRVHPGADIIIADTMIMTGRLIIEIVESDAHSFRSLRNASCATSHNPNRRPGEHTAADPQEINHPAAR